MGVGALEKERLVGFRWRTAALRRRSKGKIHSAMPMDDATRHERPKDGDEALGIISPE
ncbi:MAG: hypothetical protein LPK09_05080 [Hymenobacteraceae bacterium]|nr:hypothetical protein [Hymenobacteraceae bacterium]